MKVYSNVTDPGKKKKKNGSSYPEYTPGKETKTYTSSRALTGDPRYGKENPKGKDAPFIEKAREKKQDIAYDKSGKTYRAGVTTVTKEPGKFTAAKIAIDKPTIKLSKSVTKPTKPTVTAKKEVKSTGSKKGKLKPMSMTYGTDSPKKGGGTSYKNKVKSLLGRR